MTFTIIQPADVEAAIDLLRRVPLLVDSPTQRRQRDPDGLSRAFAGGDFRRPDLVWAAVGDGGEPRAVVAGLLAGTQTVLDFFGADDEAALTAVVAAAMTCLQLLRTNRNVVPLWGAHLGLSDALISATFAAGALLDVAMFLPSGRWMDRYGRLAGILPSLFIMGASLAVAVIWTSPAGFVASTCLMGFGNGFGSGIVMTMGADLAPAAGRDRFLGWWQGVSNIGAAAGPFTVSALTSVLGLTAGMWGTAILGVVGGLWAWAAMPRAYAHAGIDLRGRALAVGEVRRGRRLSAP